MKITNAVGHCFNIRRLKRTKIASKLMELIPVNYYICPSFTSILSLKCVLNVGILWGQFFYIRYVISWDMARMIIRP